MADRPENVIRPGTLRLLDDGGDCPCPYLPGRTARNEFLIADRIDGATYQEFLKRGFRRSGRVIYRPICDGCRECVSLRVPVDAFCPTRSQRRAVRKNPDVKVEIGRPAPTDERWHIYKAYLDQQHDGSMSSDREDFERFLYAPTTDTIEMVYRVEGRIVAVGVIDTLPDGWSSVYFYFDPAESRRSLGVFSTLREIDECRARGLRYWYAGYWVRDCRRMSYKADYCPHELLGTDGQWRRSK